MNPIANTHLLLPFYNLSEPEFEQLHDSKLHKFNLSKIIKNLNTNNDEYISPNNINHKLKLKQKFSILTINARSLNKNLNKLEILLNHLNFDPTVILISETWINSKKPLLQPLKNY